MDYVYLSKHALRSLSTYPPTIVDADNLNDDDDVYVDNLNAYNLKGDGVNANNLNADNLNTDNLNGDSVNADNLNTDK